MGKKIKSVGEFGLIQSMAKFCPGARGVVKGIGDDAAVIEHDTGKLLLVTADMLVQDVHFTLDMNANDIGYKALACSISDIAAMGGRPAYAVVSIGLSPETEVDVVHGIYQGMGKLARKYKIGIVGGDTVKSRELMINVTLLGRVKRSFLVTRGGARPGDSIYVTGPLGGSFKTGKHLRFTPRLEESQFLIKYMKPSAMIDISDGLAADLGHILEESRVGAVLAEDQIPVTKGMNLEQALYGGEDYELLFTLPPHKVKWLNQLKRVPFEFYQIGEISGDRGHLYLVEPDGNQHEIETKGFTHF